MKKGKLGIQTKLKMNEDVMKSKNIYNNLLHLLRKKNKNIIIKKINYLIINRWMLKKVAYCKNQD